MENQQTILLIDDDPSIREVMSLALETRGIEVLTAVNGKEGLDVLELHPETSLILLDLLMPVMDGWDFIKSVGENQNLNQIPIIVTTASSVAPKSIGKTVILHKPLDLTILYNEVEKHVRLDL